MNLFGLSLLLRKQKIGENKMSLRYLLIDILKKRGILCYMQIESKEGESRYFLLLRKANSTWIENSIGKITDSIPSLLKAVLFKEYGEKYVHS